MDKLKEEESIPKWRLVDFHTSFDMHGNILDIEKDEWVSPNLLLYYGDFSAGKGNGEGEEEGRCYMGVRFIIWRYLFSYIHSRIILEFI